MATEKHLVNAVKDSLENDGELGRIKAEMRKQVIKLLDNSSSGNKKIEKDDNLPRDIYLINQLIREYLDWIGYKYTSSVLISECDLGKQRLDRIYLAESLGVEDNNLTKKIPLLFGLVETFKSFKNKKFT